MRRLVEPLVHWLERHLPGPARPEAIVAREARTEAVRLRAIRERVAAERLQAELDGALAVYRLRR